MANSQDKFKPQNVAPIIEQLAAGLGIDKNRIGLTYDTRYGQQTVFHPLDKVYGPAHSDKPAGAAMDRYMQFARRSRRLTNFQNQSPANLPYFKPT